MSEDIRVHVEASPEKSCGVYSNTSIISTDGAESRIDFLYVDRANQQGNDLPAHLVARVIMTTSELANLSETLSKHLSHHLEKEM